MKGKHAKNEKLPPASAFAVTPRLLEEAYQAIGAHDVPLEQNMGMSRFVLPWVFAPWGIDRPDHPCRQLVFTYRRPGVIVLMFRAVWQWYVEDLYATLQKTCSITPESFSRMFVDAARVVMMGERRRVCIPKEIAGYLKLGSSRHLVMRARSAFIEIMSKADYDTGASAAQAEASKIPPDAFVRAPGSSRGVPGRTLTVP